MRNSSASSRSFVASAWEATTSNPVRQCVGCRGRFPQGALVRFVRNDGTWQADAPGSRHRRPGRGAYLCSANCAKRVEKNRRYPGLAPIAAEYGFLDSSAMPQ